MLMDDGFPLRYSSLPVERNGYSRGFAGKEFARRKREGSAGPRRHFIPLRVAWLIGGGAQRGDDAWRGRPKVSVVGEEEIGRQAR